MYGQTNCFVLPEGAVQHQIGKKSVKVCQQMFEARSFSQFFQCANVPNPSFVQQSPNGTIESHYVPICVMNWRWIHRNDQMAIDMGLKHLMREITMSVSFNNYLLLILYIYTYSYLEDPADFWHTDRSDR